VYVHFIDIKNVKSDWYTVCTPKYFTYTFKNSETLKSFIINIPSILYEFDNVSEIVGFILLFRDYRVYVVSKSIDIRFLIDVKPIRATLMVSAFKESLKYKRNIYFNKILSCN